ncbi:MAG: glutamate-cysteine ligase family protein [bacterium]
MSTREREAWVEERVRANCFGGAATVGPVTLGAELELLAFDARSRTITPIFGDDGSLELVRAAGTRLAWCEEVSAKGVPRFTGRDGGSLTFEPGGQLEYASAVHHSADRLLHELCAVEHVLRETAEGLDIELVACGVDPFNGPDDAPLQLMADRYQRMARYFAAIGTDGARMMRQTASLQLNIGGVPSAERWAVANAIAPWLLALFANSSQYAGQDTGYASYRAQTWRGVDPSRTGLFEGHDPVREYSAFALGARAFLADDAAPPFERLDAGLLSDACLDAHLSTLFPEVRPRGYLEFRSVDAVGGEARAAAVALVTGIIGDPTASREALAVTGTADSALLACAGHLGVGDARVASRLSDLVDIAMAGCNRLGRDIVSESTLAAIAPLVARAITRAGSSTIAMVAHAAHN